MRTKYLAVGVGAILGFGMGFSIGCLIMAGAGSLGWLFGMAGWPFAVQATESFLCLAVPVCSGLNGAVAWAFLVAKVYRDRSRQQSTSI